MTSFDLPAGIGPHEGRECELMLAGKKNMAMFCDMIEHYDYFPENIFAPHVRAGTIVRREEHYLLPNTSIITKCVFFARVGEEWRMEAAHLIQEAIFTRKRKNEDQDDVHIGRLLGYTEEEIQAFLIHKHRHRTNS